MNDNITIRRATTNDLESIALVMQEAGINPVGLDQWVESFIIAEVPREKESVIIATAGLEKYGSKGLLRSLVIRKKAWSVENSLNMLRLILTHAGQNGLTELYLLTESPSLFIHMEFTPLTSDDVPPELLSSEHFQQNRAKAVPMRKVLR